MTPKEPGSPRAQRLSAPTPSRPTPISRRGRTLPLALLALALATAALSLHAWFYHRFMVDDAFISLRYAERFLHGRGLTWNDGETVEGYTNLLWILGCAVLGKLGLDLVVAARVLGFAGTLAAMGALIWAHRGDTFRKSLPGLAGALALALSGCVAIWTVGGLEPPLLAALLAWALALSFPLLAEPKPPVANAVGVGVLLGLIVLTRADGAIFTVAFACGMVASRGPGRETLKRLLPVTLLPLLFFLGQLAFRWNYYHDWLPNSAYAKVGFAPERIGAGLKYVAGAIYLAGLLVPSLFAFRLAEEPAVRRKVRYLGTIILVWLVYLVLVGGDFFPGGRHLVPAVVVLAFLFATTLEIWLSRRRSSRPVLWGVGASLSALLVLQLIDPANAHARNEKDQWVWDGECIGDLLATAFGKQHALLAVDPAGCVPYFSGLPSVDMLGINDYYLAHHRPADFGKGALGHELGSGAYVLSRKPDLVLFNLPTGNIRPYFRSGREMFFGRDSDFGVKFVPVSFEAERPYHLVSIVWSRREGGAVGIRRDPNRIWIPAYLFAANEASRARLDPEGRIGVDVDPEAAAVYFPLPVPPGAWTLRLEQSGGDLDVRVLRFATRELLAAGKDGMSFQLEGSRPDSLILALESSGPGGAHVRSVALERSGPPPPAAP